jgi:hypothetical protein
MIVARHEVPGGVRKIARPSGTIEPISAWFRRFRLQHTFQEGYLAFLKRHELRFEDKYLDHDFDRPSGTRPLWIATQALRAWLLSACPSGTKAIRPSKGLALSQRLWS